MAEANAQQAEMKARASAEQMRTRLFPIEAQPRCNACGRSAMQPLEHFYRGCARGCPICGEVPSLNQRTMSTCPRADLHFYFDLEL